MKRINNSINLIVKSLIYTVMILVLIQFSYAEDEGYLWLERMDKAEKVQHSFGNMRQVITTSSGSERVLEMDIWTDEFGDLTLMEYTNPARVKGDKILHRDGGDNIWYYMNRRDVTRHFTGHKRRESAMGSDFSYEDLSQGDMVEDYTAEVLFKDKVEGVECVKLKCVPTESGPSYEFLYVWTSLEDHMSRLIEYYDEDGLIKTLYIRDYKRVEDRKTAMVMEMVNNREGSRTVMEYLSISYRDDPGASLFTIEALSD